MLTNAALQMAATSSLSSLLLQHHHHHPMMMFFFSLFYFFLLTFSLLSLLYLFFTLYRYLSPARPNPPTVIIENNQSHDSDPTHLAVGDENVSGSGLDGVKIATCEETECSNNNNKKKKKKNKKKGSSSGLDDGIIERKEELLIIKEKEELVCLYPFTSSSSITQRKIKQHYDQLMKLQTSNELTILQVGEFANCLVETRSELQHKSEAIQRKYTIRKALLCKAGRSSFNRLRQQIYKLELQHKRLEEDTFVYNWLQEQLKLSPAYKKMLEISAFMEMNAKSDDQMENKDSEFSDISFEELLAQEKKDSFWQKNGKPKMCSS